MKKSKMIKLGFVTATLFMSNTLMANGDIAKAKPVKEKTWKSKHKFFGFSQIGVGFGDGVTKTGDYKFQADRIRLGWKYFSGPLAGKVFLDFAKDGSNKNGIGVPELIKDAFISYKFDDAVVVKAGVLKTPVGMGFTIPGWNLDVIKRGFDKKLAFERDFGVMLSGRDIGFGNNGKVNGLEMGHERPWKGFGYDLMFAGQAGRSGAVVNANAGNGEGYMGRLMFDWGQELHTEVGYGISKEAGGTNGAKDVNKNIIATTDLEDYKVFNAGIDSHFDRVNVKAEYYHTTGIRGVKNWDVNTLALTGTYYLTDTFEGAIKYIGGSGDKGSTSADVANTYVGFNYYINPKNNKMDRKSRRSRNRHRIQLNYVLASGDAGNANAKKVFKYAGGAFFQENAILAQYQFKF
ncbi:hypothetical protein MNB_SV-13-1013 [hydrothermal vent metagenome]|uniref:Porin domain-containing protein n=1 Tax=hydrothermal vent metagenome TaxID=652676 RepID=A0A1W1D1F5_9ZZZZ